MSGARCFTDHPISGLSSKLRLEQGDYNSMKDGKVGGKVRERRAANDEDSVNRRWDFTTRGGLVAN